MIGRLAARVRTALVELLRECRSLEALALLLVTAILITRHAAGTPVGARLLAPLWSSLGVLHPLLLEPLLQGQIVAVVLQLVPPLLFVLLVHRRPLRDFGAGLGDWRFWTPLAAAVLAVQVLVVALYLARDPAYIARYPSLTAARTGGAVFLLWESSRVLYMLTWELLFRGYLLFALAGRMGRLACVVQMVPFALTHIPSKPVSEIYFTLVSGVLSGVFALEARSAWPLVLLHAGGAVLLDALIVYR
jgi:membrane protease YdiL (CAAX protease family)